MYCQCRLQKAGTEQVVWIPEQFACINKVIKIKNDGEWDDGWVVYAVYCDFKLEKPPDAHNTCKRHKNATGDNLPKAKNK